MNNEIKMILDSIKGIKEQTQNLITHATNQEVDAKTLELLQTLHKSIVVPSKRVKVISNDEKKERRKIQKAKRHARHEVIRLKIENDLLARQARAKRKIKVQAKLERATEINRLKKAQKAVITKDNFNK